MNVSKQDQKKKLGQAGFPSGWIGKLMSYVMLRHNRTDNQWTVSLLDVQPRDHVLEIGFGPGQAIQLAAKKVKNGIVAGIDHSELMLKEAVKKNRNGIERGIVELRQGDVSNISYSDEFFDKVFSINSIYFWPDPVQNFREIMRILKPSGVLAITVRKGEREAYKPFTSEKISNMFNLAGFHDIHCHEGPDPGHPIFCVTGIK